MVEAGKFQNDGGLEKLAHTAGYGAQKLAVLSSLSPRQFRRIFHERFGCAPRQWLNDLKLISAQRRLLAGEPVKRIAFELGYKNSSAFCYWFKHVSGSWPAEYINNTVASAGQLAGPAAAGALPG